MNVFIEADTWIDRPPLEVFEFIRDPAHWTRTSPGVVRVTALNDVQGVGARFGFGVALLGTTFDMTTEFTRYEPGVALAALNSRESGVGTELVTLLSAEDGGTRLSRTQDMEFRGMFARMTAPLVRAAVQRNLRTELENIKEFLESDDYSAS